MEQVDTFSKLFVTPLLQFTQPGSRTFLVYLGTSLLIATIIHMRDAATGTEHRRPLSFLFPKQVYTHPSAVVDYIYFFTNTILYAVIMAPLGALGPFISNTITGFLESVSSPYVMTEISGITATLVFTLALALLSDFGSFVSHWWMHRNPLLWEFHKVHHSAEVLTPITVYRMHPLDDIITAGIIGGITGTFDALTRFYVAPGLSPYAIYGVGIITFLFFVSGYHLRHSHIWLSYGPTLSKILISPAQHQIHHSKAKRHWNKNYGFTFAIWDYLFGSLYIPKEREHIDFGIGNNEEPEYRSALNLYLLPFKKAFRVAKAAPKKPLHKDA
jgi:sterol desaturase/sphingolipid hydroxylase (fatty acid hydroxylase superfamily)